MDRLLRLSRSRLHGTGGAGAGGAAIGAMAGILVTAVTPLRAAPVSLHLAALFGSMVAGATGAMLLSRELAKRRPDA